MPESGTYGSVRGVAGNGHPYRDPANESYPPAGAGPGLQHEQINLLGSTPPVDPGFRRGECAHDGAYQRGESPRRGRPTAPKPKVTAFAERRGGEQPEAN